MNLPLNDPSWPSPYRNLVNLLGILLIVTVVTNALYYIVYPWPAFTWQQLQELQPQELPLYAFERGNLQFTLSGENYIIFERWTGNPFTVNLAALDAYMILYAACIAVLLAIVSTLPRFWFYIGALITAFLLASFRWDSLLLFGLDNRYVGLVLIITILGLLSYFQFFRNYASLALRLFSFLLLAAGTGILVKFAGTSHALRLLAVNTLNSSLVLLIIFIILIAHQLLASFVSLAVSASRTHSLKQFLWISGIYLLNLWVTYLDRIGWMEWDYTIPSFILFVVSAALTAWTIRERFVLYESIVKNEILLVVFILGFSALAFTTYGYFIATSNDIALLSISDLILYTHLGYGMMFLLYVTSNFLGVFEKGLPVNKILYKPTTMPYFTYRFAGLIFTLALVFYNNWTTHVNHFASGYYTALGDVYSEDPTGKALTFYKRAHLYAPYNQHAATRLADMEASVGNFPKQLAYAVDANRFKPTEFTLLNADHLYFVSENAYEDIMLLRTARSLFPSSGPILNNLGLAYSRVRLPDSAVYYFSRAEKDDRTSSTAEMNLLGVLAKTKSTRDADSIFQQAPANAWSVKANALALANHQGRIIDQSIPLPKDSLFNLFTASAVANLLTNHTNKIDTAWIAACVAMSRKPENLAFRHMIMQSAAKASYAAGQVNRAVQWLQEVVFLGTNEGANNYTLGLMMMDQGNHDVAINYFLYAINQNFRPASVAIATCLAEEGRIDEAIVNWDSIARRKDSTLHVLGESMKRVLAAPPAWFNELNESERLYYALYRIPPGDSALFNRLITQIVNEDLRAKAYLNRARQYFAVDELPSAARQYAHLKGLHLRDTELFAEIKYFEMQLLAAQGRMDALQAIIDQGILFGPYHETERVYYEGLKLWAAGDTAEAGKRFDWLSQNNWYFDEGVVTAARFNMNDIHKAYRILSDALQVNQESVKILKAYIPVALARGFDRYAADALQTLRTLLTPEAFEKYVAENQLSGLLGQ